MSQQVPTVRLVLLGGGHANTQVVLHMPARSLPACVEATLVSDRRASVYSGMLPGCVGGAYASGEEAEVDCARLCASRGWRFVEGAAEAVRGGAVHLRGGAAPVPYDVLAVDVGSTTAGADRVEGAAEHAVPTRPIGLLLARIREFEERRRGGAGDGVRVAVVGGGAAGVELAMAARARFGPRAAVALVDAGQRLLPREPAALAVVVARRLAALGVAVHHGRRVCRVRADAVELAGGAPPVPADLVLFATGAGAQPLLAASEPRTDAAGFMEVDARLESVSHPNVFGAGDCVTMRGQPAGFPPKAGVYAVRQGPVLLHNLRAAVLRLAGAAAPPPVEYEPQSGFLALLNCGGGVGAGAKFGVAFEGPWVWRLKDWIDRAWMSKFSEEEEEEGDEQVDFEPAVAADGPAAPGSAAAAAALLLDREAADFLPRLAVLRRMASDDVYRDGVVSAMPRRRR